MPNDKQKTGQGLITEVSDIQTHGDSGRQFMVVNLGPKEKYSCWKPELFDEFKVGSSIDFKYTVGSKGYKNIVSLESDGNGSRAGAQSTPNLDELIVRQTAIKVAGPMMSVNPTTPAEMVKEVTEIADGLVAWVWEKKTTEPEPPEEE